MNKNAIGFLIGWLVLSISLALVVMIKQLPAFSYSILVGIAGGTAFIFYRMVKSTNGSFATNYLVSIVLKLLISGVFISVVIFLDKPNSEPNVVFFMITYLLFTSLEVGFLFKRLNS